MIAASFKRLFDWKIRGVRWVEIIGVMLVAAMIFSVYVAKAAAAREGGRISEIEQQISDNGRRVRLLRAEVAKLEQPARLEALSRQAGLGPVDVRRRADEDSLTRLAPIPDPKPVIIEPTQPVGDEPDPAPEAPVAVPEAPR